MRASYLVELIETYCKENNLDISEMYRIIAERYQQEWGVNIALQMQNNGKWDMPLYLEKLNIVERYISILNKIKKENN
jgi:hypothetical protein